MIMDGENTSESRSSLRSCTTCSKAKAKCVRQQGQEICERCARLKKECYLRDPVVRRRKGVTKTTRAAQLEKLESKIEHLVNALATTQSQRGYSTDLGHHSPASYTSDKPAKRAPDVMAAICEGLDALEHASADPPISVPSSTTTPSTMTVYTTSPANMTTMCSPSAAFVASVQDMGVSVAEADLLLDRFQRLLAPHFPFLQLGSATAQQLYMEKPTLLSAIITVSMFHDYPRQQMMVRRLIRDITDRIYIIGEKSVSLIQSVLVLVAWFYPHVFGMPQLTNLLHTAQALILDLGLDRAPATCPKLPGGGPPKSGGMHPPPRKEATMEEHRAFLGTFYYTSMLATSFKRPMAMRHTKYLEEAMRDLERNVEYESDLLLVQIVRLQVLTDDIAMLESPSSSTPVYAKAFKVDLERLARNDPCGNTDNIFLRLSYCAVELQIWEMSLNDLQEDPTKPLRPHLENIAQLVRTINRFLDIFYTIPASSYLTLPFAFFGAFAHILMALVKLASLEVDGLDMRDLCDELVFADTIEKIAEGYEYASRVGPEGILINNESFNKWAMRLRWMKSMYGAKYVQDGSEAPQDRLEAVRAMWSKQPQGGANGYSQPSPAQLQQPTPPDDMLSGDFFNYLDDKFWQSFAGDGLDLGFSEMAMT